MGRRAHCETAVRCCTWSSKIVEHWSYIAVCWLCTFNRYNSTGTGFFGCTSGMYQDDRYTHKRI